MDGLNKDWQTALRKGKLIFYWCVPINAMIFSNSGW